MLQNIFSSTWITFNPEIIETNELKKCIIILVEKTFWSHFTHVFFMLHILVRL